MTKPRYIVIEGPIGVGKTSLAKMLAKEFAGRIILEKPEGNPFLEQFYANPKKFAFQAQVFFLLSRFQQQQEIIQLDLFAQDTISDYLFAKDRIFAYLNLQADELVLYERIFSVLGERIVKPDIVIYLQAKVDVLIERIRRRGTKYEQKISEEYLKQLVDAYNEYFFYYNETPLLVVNTSEIDFVKHEADFNDLVKEIKSTKRGTWHYIPLGSRDRD